MKRKLLPNLYSLQQDKTRPSHTVFGYVYVLGTDDGGLAKIGTTNDLWERFRKLQGMSPRELEPLTFWACRSGKSVEAALHTLFRDYRKHGEWFYFGDWYSARNQWKYRHLALSALLTCSYPPIPLHGSVLNGIQFEHVPDDDPVHDVSGGGDWSGRECYPLELLAPFYPREDGSFSLVGWTDELMRRYGFA